MNLEKYLATQNSWIMGQIPLRLVYLALKNHKYELNQTLDISKWTVLMCCQFSLSYLSLGYVTLHSFIHPVCYVACKAREGASGQTKSFEAWRVPPSIA